MTPYLGEMYILLLENGCNQRAAANILSILNTIYVHVLVIINDRAMLG